MTNQIARYDCTCQEGHMAEEPDGEYVRYEDVKHLLHPEPGCATTCDCGPEAQAICRKVLAFHIPDSCAVRKQLNRLVEGYCCCPKSGTSHERTPQCDI